MTCVERWLRRVQIKRDREDLTNLSLASCILNPYLASNMIYNALEETQPYSWQRMRRHWRLFRNAKKPEKQT